MAETLTPDLCVIGAGPGGLSVAAAAANSNVYLVSPGEVSALAADIREAWGKLLATGAGTPAAGLRKQVAQVLADFGCLPTQVFERLTSLPIAPM